MADPAVAPHAFDLIDLDHLRGQGSVKWSMFPDSIGAFVAEMDFGTAPVITDALHAAIDGNVLGYLPDKLSAELSQACAGWQAENYDWPVDPSHVYPIADVVRGLELTIEWYSRPGSPVILPVPAYMPFLHVPTNLGRTIITVPMIDDGPEGYRMDLTGIEQAFIDGGHLLILINPHNPTGRVFSRDELISLSEIVAAHDGRVFADEIHSPLVYPGGRHVNYASLSAATANHTVTAVSASKAWSLPGLKCAQLILTNEDDRERWTIFGHEAMHGASILGVIANTVAYRDAADWLDDTRGYLDLNRRLLADLLAEHCPKINYRMPQGTYIAWLDCRDLDLPGNPADFFRERAGVALTDSMDCGVPGFARMIFATPQPILRQAVEHMGAALSAR